MKKTLYTLSVNNYQPEISALTFPFMKAWAKKIGADFHVITERKFTEWPVTYEKFQVYELAKEHGNDWNIFFDADTLIHPDFYDFTVLLNKDTTFSNGSDFSPIRFKPDAYFLRDGRYIGKGNWCAAFSDWCLDYYHPLDDITLEEAVANIGPTVSERGSGCIEPAHLIDDYVVSRNIARYGLKHILMSELEVKHKVTRGQAVTIQALDQNITGGLVLHWYSIDNKLKQLVMQRNIMNWLGSGLCDPNILVNVANSWNNQAGWGEWVAAQKIGGFDGQKLVKAIRDYGVKI